MGDMLMLTVSVRLFDAGNFEFAHDLLIQFVCFEGGIRPLVLCGLLAERCDCLSGG